MLIIHHQPSHTPFTQHAARNRNVRYAGIINVFMPRRLRQRLKTRANENYAYISISRVIWLVVRLRATNIKYTIDEVVRYGLLYTARRVTSVTLGGVSPGISSGPELMISLGGESHGRPRSGGNRKGTVSQYAYRKRKGE